MPHQNDQKKIQELFEYADPKYLMTPEDYSYWLSLPQRLHLYRGSNFIKGMSWTLSQEKALWFANRFDKHGEVYELEVDKSKTYGYFSDRNEEEIIVSPDIFKNF